jgi:NADH:ubiquinone oxidoreductase subunit 5 (subunit L)/multisubunit Na+/H+ antiporter MnhA subunit
MAQVLAHGLIVALLFDCVGLIQRKTGTTVIAELSGLMNPIRGLPFTMGLMLLALMAAAGIPGLAGFPAELLVFEGSWTVFPRATLICIVASGFTAVYAVRLFNRVGFGRLDNNRADWQSTRLAERLPAVVLTTLVVLAGIFGVAFLDRLSVAVESHLGARPPALDEAPWWHSLVPLLAQEWRKLRYFGWLILLLVLSVLIPGLNALSPLLWCLGGAWMLALELLDGVFSRHGHPFPAALRCLRQHRACAFGFGLTAVVLSVMPLLNCLALPAGVAGATLLFHRHFGNRGY